MSAERLQKILAQAGVASRRHAEELIRRGQVRVNGELIRELGSRADPATDVITVDGRPVNFKTSHHYYAYYKPRGLVVSQSDDLGRETVFHHLKLAPGVQSVGRLDKESEGLLLLSDDGDFILKYTHPRYEVAKVYRVQVSRALAPEERRALLQGVTIEQRHVRAFQVKNLRGAPQEAPWVEIELREGMKREIRRMLELFGIRVLRLVRVRHGEVTLGDFEAGECRELERRPR